MNQTIEYLCAENTDAQLRGELFLQTLGNIRKMENQKSYSEIISGLLPLAEKNLESFEEKGNFQLQELKEYIAEYEKFQEEYEKYQIWLVGTGEDCDVVQKLLNPQKVHILGVVNHIHSLLGESDYIFVCSSFDRFRGEYVESRELRGARIVRFDFIREAVGTSPESSYVNEGTKKAFQKAEGIVTGMSYVQRGLSYDKIGNNLMCLARPSQDIYMDYQEMLWAYHEIVEKRNHPFRYCVIEMNYYRLWYDASYSATKSGMFNSFLHLGVLHHMDLPGRWLREYGEDRKICRELMGDDYINDLYRAIGYHMEEECRIRGARTYIPDEEQYCRELPLARKLFDKNYPETLEQNIGILRRYIKFLKQHNIRCLFYLPPFPRIYIETAPQQMVETTYQVLEELTGEFGKP